jgi:hypothetical protein
MADIRRAIETGGARIPAARLFGWLVLAVSLRQWDELASLLRFPSVHDIPRESLASLVPGTHGKLVNYLSNRELGPSASLPPICTPAQGDALSADASQSLEHIIASVPLPSNERLWRFSKARREARHGPDALSEYAEQLVPGSTRCQYATALMEAITKAGFTRNERTGEWVPPG